MAKMDKPANETFVKKTVEDARTELNGKIENLQKEIGIKHNEVMNKLDSIAGSIEKFDEEQTALSYRVSEHTDQLENHEKRIKKIEKKTLLPPSLST